MTEMPPENVKKCATVSVVTWNIHSCIGMDRICDPNRIAAAIEALPHDIFCLQEVGWHLRGTQNIDQFAVILDRFDGFHYTSLTKTQNAHFGNLLLSKYPITGVETIPLGRWWGIPRVLQSVQITIGGTKLWLMNTHLGLDPIERYTQINIIIRHVTEILEGDPQASVILCGDFNALGTSGNIVRLGELFDIARAFRTFPSPRPLLSLDRFFAKNLKRVLGVEIMRQTDFKLLSDHLPVLGTFEV